MCDMCILRQHPYKFVIIVGPYEDFVTEAGGRLNKKDGLTRYGNSHVKDKTS